METNNETTFGISQLNKTNIPNTKEVYKAPVMEIIEIQIEQGFQMSGAELSSSYDPLKELIF